MRTIFGSFFFAIDHLIYWLAKVAFSVFCYISKVDVTGEQTIVSFTRRIYAILGIAMMFILAYNLLTYIVNPDKVTDKNAGAATFIKDLIIALVVIAILPEIFVKLFAFQNTIITSGVISNLVLGGFSDNGANQSDDCDSPGQLYIEAGANNMVANVYSAFLTPKGDDIYSALDCADDAIRSKYQEYCDAYDQATLTGDIDSFGDFITDKDYDYSYIWSTVGGLVLTFFMLSFCLNLGQRAFKLGILEILAPVSFLMEIVPNKSGTRKAWIDMLINTYVEVFIYQAVVFITVYLITLIPGLLLNLWNETLGCSPSVPVAALKIWVMIFLIFGLLQFARSAPKLICDLIGIKDTGTIGEAAKRAVAMGAVGTGLFGSTFGRASRNFMGTGKGVFQRDANGNITGFNGWRNVGSKILSGIGGASSGVARTLRDSRNVHSIQDARTMRRRINSEVIEARVNRDAYARSHDATTNNVFENARRVFVAHASDIRDNIAGGVRAYTGAKTPYEIKSVTENVMQEFKRIYEENVETIWKNDSKWQNLKAAYDKAVGEGRYGTAYAKNHPNDPYSAENVLKRMYSARQEALKKKRDQLAKAAGMLNNHMDANQGVDGIHDFRFDLNALIQNPETYIDTIDRYTVGEVTLDPRNLRIDQFKIDKSTGAPKEQSIDYQDGYQETLINLSNDKPYQDEKVKRTLAEDARRRRQEAAQQAQQNGNNNNNNGGGH